MKTKGGFMYSKGNTKLGTDTLIFNMNAAADCPSRALGYCKLGKRCYADKAERLYPQCLPFRRAQAAYWESHTAIEIAAEICAVVKRSRVKIKYVRYSEAGDFKTQADVDKLNLIAYHVQKSFDVAFYGYSARRDLDFTEAMHLLVKGSGHESGNNGRTIARPPAEVKAGQGTDKLFMENGQAYHVCPGDCRPCFFCKKANGFNIVFPIH